MTHTRHLEPNLDTLEQLTRAATPGPWKAASNGPFGHSVWPDCARLDREDEIPMIADVDSGEHDDAANAAFIAAANPATILSLLARLRAAEEEARRLRAGLYEACLLYNERGLQPPDPADTARIDRPSEMAPPACVLCHADVNRGTLVCRECATKHDAALRKLAEGAE